MCHQHAKTFFLCIQQTEFLLLLPGHVFNRSRVTSFPSCRAPPCSTGCMFDQYGPGTARFICLCWPLLPEGLRGWDSRCRSLEVVNCLRNQDPASQPEYGLNAWILAGSFSPIILIYAQVPLKESYRDTHCPPYRRIYSVLGVPQDPGVNFISGTLLNRRAYQLVTVTWLIWQPGQRSQICARHTASNCLDSIYRSTNGRIASL